MRKHDHTNQQGEAQQANYLRNRRTASPGSSCYQHAAKVGFVGAAGRTEHPRWCGERPAGWTDLVPELNEQPQDHRVTKRTWGAFTNTGLEDYSKGVDVTQTIIAGVATSIGVESTARQAYELGFNVTLATDAMTDRSAEAHANSLTRIFSAPP